MSQSPRHSALEAVANVAIGYGVALVSQIVVFAGLGVEASFRQNLAIGAWFTGVSLVRSYAVRRMFNRWHT
jgi:hypothetical protein